MAKPPHTKHIRIASRPTARRRDVDDKDAERFRLRLTNDQRRADLALQRQLKEVWEL
ncbi:hypothetical protein HZU72_17570 [Halomonas sp. QX-2]|uniref:Uncharacterized protein n=1 Tax=Vreelandella sedimenti TaxID=2729618 RepID=A0A7Z0NA22_9GAMM|nr:hypothetical protein [Halomonas sedimenti]NYT74223.1 hypothetical protein [Halomonas sedimenti]